MMVCLSGCPRLRQAPSLAAVVAFLALPAIAAEPATPASAQALAERLEKLERRNALLEQAIRALQVRNAQIDAVLSNESVSETEPELATRLKAVEYRALDIQKQAKVLDAIEGFSAGGRFTTVAQRASRLDDSGDGLPDYGFVAAGWEQVVEAYYRFRVHQRFELTPDFQYIRHPAGNASADAVKVVGVRANLSF